MTSEERREQRFQRRKAKRLAKKAQLHEADGFDTVFSYANLYRSYRFCKKGVAWKASVQKYIVNAPLNVYRTWRKLKEGRFKTPGFHEFVIFERGKCRRIRSTMIGERVVQRCLCDYSLIPLLERTFIYDNGASMKGKGYDFAVKRLTRHLHEHYRKHGTNGYILLFDFSKFFDRVSHELVKRIVRDEITDEKILKLCDHLIDAFGNVGLGLGSQISQVLALASANRLDHYIKEVLRIRGYGRYMDDGYLLHESKEYLKHCLAAIRKVCKELHITLNTKKTQIVKLSHGFTWLKIRFFLTETGRVVKKIYRRSVHVMRRKLKTFQRKLLEGSMTLSDVYNSWQSWRSYARRFNAWRTVQSMEKLYHSLITVGRRQRYVYQNL